MKILIDLLHRKDMSLEPIVEFYHVIFITGCQTVDAVFQNPGCRPELDCGVAVAL